MPDKKIRVHELSKLLEISNDELISFLKAEGVEVKSHSSSIDEETADLITELIHSKTDDADTDSIEPPAPVDKIAAELGIDEDIPIPVTRIKHIDRKAERRKNKKKGSQDISLEEPAETEGAANEIHLKTPIVVKELADAMKVKSNVVIMELMSSGVMATINQSIEIDVAKVIAEKHGLELVVDKRAKGSGETAKSEKTVIEPEDRVFENAEVEPRPPIVAFLGHVDHGKTSLQDKMRDSNVAAGEAGAITQHVGASQITWKGQKITFVDTPGHAAFTAMRARGANITDIVILVVAADDGFMPQTIEALNHARAAGVTIIIAMNKIDLASADPEKVLRQMMENEIMPEDWGGEYAAVKVSAETGEGLEDLLDRIVLETEMMEVKANSQLPGQAVVLEAELEQGLGATANVIITNGTIRHGDNVLSNQYFGKVKALIDASGKRLKSAGPSTPVKLVGLNGVPNCGDKVVVCEDEKAAKRLAAERQDTQRQEDLQPNMAASLDDLLEQMHDEARTNLKVIVKTDVKGTCEAVCESLMELDSPKIKLDIIHRDVGAITESDVLLASASGAVIVGFHVRVNPGVNKLAKSEGVEINLYTIIYELIDRIKAAMEGRMEPEYKETVIGKAKILQIFKLTKQGKVCGSTVTEGAVRINAKARVYREDELIYNGDLVSLKRFQDSVKEVKAGMECGIKLDNFKDFEVDDVIQVYQLDEVKQTL